MPTLSTRSTLSTVRDFGAPAAAYRADIDANGAEFGPHDAAWLAAATLVEHAALREHPGRDALLRDAIEIAQELVGDDTLRTVGAQEWGQRDRFDGEILILLARRLREAGARRLAAALLDAQLRAAESLAPVQRGRIMVERARLAKDAGALDEARDRYEALAALARSARSTELSVLAWNGFAAVAQVRGNHPEMHRYARRAVRVADREGFTAMSQIAHYSLMLVAVGAKRFDDALVEGWRVYQLAIGDAVQECSALQNLGQLLLEAGRPAPAEAVFMAICARPLPARILLPALSGLAVASAACAHEARLEWSVAEVRAMHPMIGTRHEVADALAECAAALATVGRDEEAARFRADARRLAERYGYHAIAFRIDEADAAHARDASAGAGRGAVPRVALAARGAAVVQDLQALMPEALPEHVHVALVPA